jgi:predicted ferric reductase
MRSVLRGIIWFGVYLFLVLVPLVTAAIFQPPRVQPPALVEVAVALGFVGFSLMALEFALITRVQAAAGVFGEDSLQLFHNLMGTVALAFILAHPILLISASYPADCWLNPFAACANRATITAAVALYAVLLLVVTSILRKQLRLKYEIWQVMHGVLALVAVVGALIHIFTIGRYSSMPQLQVVWLLYAVILIYLIVWHRILRPLLHWDRRWEVVENRQERGDARTLVVKPIGHAGFNFEPGQFAWIKTGPTPFTVGQHPISISSPADVEPGGSVAFTIKNLGDWSGKTVPSVKPGDKVWLDGPHGVFSMDREQGMGYVFVGGGVGITPLYSMCQTMAARGDVRPVVLFYGARSLEEATFREEFAALEKRMNLTVVYVLSNPGEGWEGETGFINAEVLSRHLPPQHRRFVYMICGPDPLMDAMETAIPSLGVPADQVLTERFAMV